MTKKSPFISLNEILTSDKLQRQDLHPGPIQWANTPPTTVIYSNFESRLSFEKLCHFVNKTGPN